MSTQSFKVKSGLTLTPVDLATLSNPQAGDLACDINDSNKIKRYDAATSAWAEVGSGGVGSLDILFAQDFESASLSSFTQTGLALDTVDPLHGKVSAKLTHQAGVSPTNDQSFKQVVAVDRKFRGQAIVMRLNVKSSASAGNVTISVYDETNAASLLSSTQLQLSNDVDGISNAVSFTIPSTSSSISYTITALPEAGSPVTFIDDIVAELSNVALLETSVTVPNITAWQGYTPTFQGFGSPSAIEFEWRQVGENVEVRGKFTSGVSTAVEARIGLPAGLTSAGTSIIPSIQMVGKAAQSAASSVYFSFATLIEPNVSYLTIGQQTSALSELTKSNANSLVSNGITVSLFASIPCAGLSATSDKTIALTQSGLVQNADSNFKGRGFVGQGTTNTGIVRLSSNISSFGDAIIYSPSATLGDSWTVTKSGIYGVFGSVDTSNAAAGVQYFLSRNSSILTPISTPSLSLQNLIGSVGYANPDNDVTQFGGTTYLEAGDIIRLQCNTATSTSSNGAYDFITITHQGSLKQVSVSSDQKITIPTSELRFEGASARGSTDTAIVRFDTQARIRGDAFSVVNTAANGTVITMLKAGRLDVSANLYKTTSSFAIGITLNQLDLTTLSVSSSEYLAYVSDSSGLTKGELASWSGFVKVGDKIRVICNSAPTADVINSLNLSFQEQDISVSVTNTLPQFSESDSCIQLFESNGFGSTNTQVVRFASVVKNEGADILYEDSPTNGASFTVREAGIYSVSFTGSTSVASQYAAIVKNQTTNVDTADNLARERHSSTSGEELLNCSWTGSLVAGDIIRPIMTAAITSSTRCTFTISKVGKPNVTGVDVTPFVNLPQPESQSEILTISGSLSTSSNLSSGTKIKSTGSGIYYLSSDGITVLKQSTVAVSLTATDAAGPDFSNVAIYLNGTFVSANAGYRSASGSTNGGVSTTLNCNPGDQITVTSGSNSGISSNTITITATALSDQILTAPETFSTDTASLTYASSAAYTLSTLQNAPVGTFITFTYAANTNTRTQTTTRPTQTDADMNTNGMLLYTRAYNAASTSGNPSAIAIQIGKGLKGKSLDLYKSAGKVTAGSLDVYNPGSTANKTGIELKEYSETTGILIIDAGYSQSSLITSHAFVFSDITNQSSGYLVINASKSPALTGIPLLQPRIATLSDVKASGVGGGTATAGAYQTRTLNTLSDPTGIVTSLASNQFTLPAGEYYVEAFAPAYSTGLNKFKIRNITDSTDAIIGPSQFNPGISSTDRASCGGTLRGVIVLSSSKIFELQHRVSLTVATTGFGFDAGFGDSEVYSVVKITRIR
jgi:hypothetical protein